MAQLPELPEMARRRRSSLTRRLIVRPLKTRIRKRQIARKRQQAAVAKAWTPVARNPKAGAKIPRSQGGGRLQKPTDFGLSEEDWKRAKAAIKAQERGPVARKAASTTRKLAAAKKAQSQVRNGIDHGTNRGYHQHRARDEDACPACLEAHATYNRAHQGVAQ